MCVREIEVQYSDSFSGPGGHGEMAPLYNGVRTDGFSISRWTQFSTCVRLVENVN